MAGKGQRKVLILGKSRAITLPQEWAEYYELTDKDQVIVLYNSLLIVIPEKHVDKIMEQSGEQIKNLLECVPNTFIIKPSVKLLAMLEDEADKRDLMVEQVAIQLLRERLNKDKD